MQSRLASINKDPTKSGQTEWFAFTWLEVVFVMGWLCWYKMRPYWNCAWIIIFTIIAALVAQSR